MHCTVKVLIERSIFHAVEMLPSCGLNSTSHAIETITTGGKQIHKFEKSDGDPLESRN